MAYRVSSRAAFLLLLLGVFSLFQVSLGEEQYVQAVNEAGDTVYLKDSRKPALYTGNFGDCLGSSNVNVTRFDAAYYKDNMTVLFHLQGNTAIKNESIMSMEPLLGLREQLANGQAVYIGVYAYGESRFDLTFNPCNANIGNLCPMRAGLPIEAGGIIPISQSDVAGIPCKSGFSLKLSLSKGPSYRPVHPRLRRRSYPTSLRQLHPNRDWLLFCGRHKWSYLRPTQSYRIGPRNIRPCSCDLVLCYCRLRR
jgi:hypothetical protein